MRLQVFICPKLKFTDKQFPDSHGSICDKIAYKTVVQIIKEINIPVQMAFMLMQMG